MKTTDVEHVSKKSGEAKLFLKLVTATAAILVLGLSVWAFWLQPPVGDLVRISGGSERSFGWQGEAVGFQEDAYADISAKALLNGHSPGELLIFGDSFSLKREGGISWINTTVALTGLQTTFVQYNSFDVIARYLQSAASREDVPKAIIIQSVERALLTRATGAYDTSLPCTEPAAQEDVILDHPVPPFPAEQKFTRRTSFESFDELVSWGALAVRLRLLGVDDVLTVDLSRSDLFTHNESSRLLLLADDVRNYRPEKTSPPSIHVALESARCGLRQVIATAEGVAPVFMVIAPDKRSVYDPWITTPLNKKTYDVYELTEGSIGPNVIDIFTPLDQAANAGTVDLYWPDDTHWGAAGHRIAGKTVAQRLLGQIDGN